MVDIQRVGSIQVGNTAGGGAQRQRIKKIQRWMRGFMRTANEQIHEQFVDLGVDDFLWRNGGLDWEAPVPPPTPFANELFDGAPRPIGLAGRQDRPRRTIGRSLTSGTSPSRRWRSD
ncbi:MAG TPA: hypothetical protein VFQ80_01060 [Thermomicrobiales bacterium]|nr:hypothetical protein [Thermomicrobiales bacterium]